MQRIYAFLILSVLCSTGISSGLKAQEPVFVGGAQSVRFKVDKGYFHLLAPCRSLIADSATIPVSAPPAETEPALCWPIRVLTITLQDGKYKGTLYVNAELSVSEHHIRIMPKDPKDADKYAELVPAHTTFMRPPGQKFAIIRKSDAKEPLYRIAFLTMCSGCEPGTHTQDTDSGPQLETEFGLIEQSFKDYASTEKHVKELASPVQVAVNPNNQPTRRDPFAAMNLYSTVNHQLADLCPQPAKACIQSYAAYQDGCKKLDTEDCGKPPACEATCTLSQNDAQKLKASFCVQTDQESAVAVPDWSEVVKRERPGREQAYPFQAGIVEVQMAPNPNTPSMVGCSVKSVYLRASTTRLPGGGISPGTLKLPASKATSSKTTPKSDTPK